MSNKYDKLITMIDEAITQLNDCYWEAYKQDGDYDLANRIGRADTGLYLILDELRDEQ